MELSGKVALITGAGNGIGEATAERLARAGATIVVVDIEKDAAIRVANHISQWGGRALAVQADLAITAQVEEMVRTALAAYGRIDVLHNNAAWHPSKSALDTSEEEWDRAMAICLKSVWLASRAVIPSMLEAGGGCIVNTASVHSFVGFRNFTVYDTAKAGLLGLTRSLAIDYAPTIRVNAVAPGGVETRAWQGVSTEERKAIVDATPLKRLATPEEIAEGVLFLVSSGATFMTGACLVMDGGWTIL